MSNWFIGLTMGVLTVLAAQKVMEKPLIVEVDEIQAEDIINAYNRGRGDALSTHPVSFELEETCLSVWANKQIVEEE